VSERCSQRSAIERSVYRRLTTLASGQRY
jgi:hypothetical protein